jgi:transglutaminase-like putative cysteine protease
VTNGTFNALLCSPFTGNVQVTFFPNYLEKLTKVAQSSATNYNFPNSSYNVKVEGHASTTLQTALFPSTQGDYNMSSKFNQTASTLLENSPSIDSAIAAISNYVSDVIVYNNNEAVTTSSGLTPNYAYQDIMTTMSSGSGICQDYAALTVSLLQSVGIPAQILAGSADGTWMSTSSANTKSGNAHAWVQAWNGSQWIVMDPTWNDSDLSVDSIILSEFMTNTTSLQNTHLIDPTQTGVPITPVHGRIK